MICGEITSRGPNMLEKSLPITVSPIEGECLKSLLMRLANIYGVTTDRLLQHCMSGFGQGLRKHACGSVDTLTVTLDAGLLATLSESLRIPADDLRMLTLTANFPSIGPRTIAFTGASNDPETNEETSNQQLQFGWCPLCLMEDRAVGGDHYLRPVWPLAVVTMCPVHKRPLIGRCQTCYRFVAGPEYALYRDQMALICPHCFTPLDGRLGYDFVTNKTAHAWNSNQTVRLVWDRIVTYEQFLLDVVKQRVKRTKKQRIFSEVSELLDLLLYAEKPNYLRPVDVFDSAFFPSPRKLGLPTRRLTRPFHICHLVERRKALAVVISILEDTPELFGFETSVPSMQRVRELMYRETYNRFERHVLNIAKLALPI